MSELEFDPQPAPPANIERIVVLDTETTGTSPAEGAALLEVAYVIAEPVNGVWQVTRGEGFMVRFDGVIPAEARAVHHIGPEEVDADSGAWQRDNVISMLLAAEEGDEMYAAHNAPFDMQFLPELTRPWIDTYQASKHLIPDAPKYSNQVLRYHLGLKPKGEFLEGLSPHRALYDTAVTGELLCHLLTLAPPEELLRLSTLPFLQKVCTFGKAHTGKNWEDVPKSYLRWMLFDSDLKNDPIGNRDLLFTAEHYYRN